MISTLSLSVETMLRVLSGEEEEQEEGKCNASFAEIGAAIDAVIDGNDEDEFMVEQTSLA